MRFVGLSLLSLLLPATAAAEAPLRARLSCTFGSTKKDQSANLHGALDFEVQPGADAVTFKVSKRRWWSGATSGTAGETEKTALRFDKVILDRVTVAGAPVARTILLAADPEGAAPAQVLANRQRMASKYVESAVMLLKVARNPQFQEKTTTVPVPALGAHAQTTVSTRRLQVPCPVGSGPCAVGEVVGTTTGGDKITSSRRIEQLTIDGQGRPVVFKGKTETEVGGETGRDELTCNVDYAAK